MKRLQLLLLTAFAMNVLHAQVGIGTTSPDAMLHVKGTTVPSTPGAPVDLINEDFTGYTVTQNHTSDPDCTTTDGWIVTSTPEALGECSSCTGDMLFVWSDDSGCIQDATAIMNFTPTMTSISISFNYRYNNFGASGDSFRVYLHNGTAQEGADLINITSDADTSYSNAAIAVTAGLGYSLRFEYMGNFDYGATVDDVLIQEAGVGSAGTYMFRLEDGQQQDGYVLTSDADGYATWKAAASATDQMLSISGNDLTISGTGGNTVTIPSIGGGHAHENGLTETSGTARLGGALTQNTFIDLTTRDLYFEGTSTGDLTFQGGSRNVMQTLFASDYVSFGGGTPTLHGDDGVGFTDSGGDPYTRDFLIGYYNGSDGGSAMATGSIEYFVDGDDEVLLEASSLNPLVDNSTRLGGSSKKWTAVWAVNGTIQTSDLNQKKNVKELNYGLNEILQLRPITFKWKKDRMGKTKIPNNVQETKIGFSAQQLLEVIPEVVQTHSWYPTDEKGNFERKKNKELGVRYSEIIPITVKAIQEQQVQMDELKEEIEKLKKEQQALLNKVNRR